MLSQSNIFLAGYRLYLATYRLLPACYRPYIARYHLLKIRNKKRHRSTFLPIANNIKTSKSIKITKSIALFQKNHLQFTFTYYV